MSAPGIFIWGVTAYEAWRRKSPVESRNEAPVWGLADAEAEAVFRHCL